MLKVPQLPALLKTWCQFHVAWFGQQTLGEEFSPFPLTVMKICAVGRHVEVRRLQVGR